MSRVLGKTNEISNICGYIQESINQKYKIDNNKTTWDDVINTINLTSSHLSNNVVDYIRKEKIHIKKSPLRKYTFISIPENENELRLIRFPSLIAKNEYKRELSLFLGYILSYYKCDKEDFYEISGEFDDVLPFLLDYLYLRDNNKEEKFSLKHLDKIKNYTRYYNEYVKEYDNFYEVTKSMSIDEFSEKGYEKYLRDCNKKDEELNKFTMNNICSISSLDAVLQLIDKNLSNNELKLLVEELMLNSYGNRKYVLKDIGINVEGYKRLKKEILKYKGR